MTPNTEPPSSAPPRKKPRFALAIATALGVGYIPKAPGTFGSVVGLSLATLVFWSGDRLMRLLDSGLVPGFRNQPSPTIPILAPQVIVLVVVAAAGVWSASRVAAYAGIGDPQYVVIDEVSGQHLTYFLALAPTLYSAATRHNPDFLGYGTLFVFHLLNWKYLLLGFILFRVFDIWKPFPARQAEGLPGGWGIMADDWIAAIYAALGLWVARYLGL